MRWYFDIVTKKHGCYAEIKSKNYTDSSFESIYNQNEVMNTYDQIVNSYNIILSFIL